MSKPYQFIGCWGVGSPEKLTVGLKKVLNAVASWGKVQQFGWSTKRFTGEDDCFGFISYMSTEETPATGGTAEGIVAAIAASGLNDLPDAWVRIKHHCLILGRESFGRVPLYWVQQGQVIWFASRLQLLLPVVGKPQVSIAGLYGYSCFSYVPTPLTPVDGIWVVAAGTEQEWHLQADDTLTSQSYQLYQWQSAPVVIKDQEAAVTQLRGLLQDALHRQLANLPSQPVGVFLSGGLDSSTVAALLVKAGVNVKAYTLDFGSAGNPEVGYAEQVANFLKIPLVKVEVTPKRIKAALEATAVALDLPFGDGVTVPLYLLCQAASQETSVIFNGEGGDQLFAGWTNKPLIAASVYHTEGSGGREVFTEQYLRTFHRLSGYEAQIFQSAVYEQVQTLNPDQWLQEALDPCFSSNLLDRLRRASLMLKGAQNIHPRATNLALSQGLMVRSPFCDFPLAEWSFQLPGEFCLRGSCEKYILKRAVECWLPPEIVWREKRGMGVPLTIWCLNELWSLVGHWLNSGVLHSEGRWVPELPRRVILGQLGGQIRGRRIGEILWLLVMWQVWRTTVLGETAKGRSIFHPFWLPYQGWRRLAGKS
ncbi:asparagine synthase-related protein [Lyngbya aestuarii]|uniref:asparagine synthase-related protein n=1 Tax=Lyngbya aestuarii TaxID=118322 RepID=UPI00403D9BE1